MSLTGVRDENSDTSSPEYDPILDMSPEEWNLSMSDPVGYGYNVNGVRQIFVKDESIELRYVYKDGRAQLKDIRVW